MARALDEDEFFMGDVCERLAALGIDSYVEHTGGGCATIHAGDPVVVKEVTTVRMGPGALAETREYEYTVHPVLGGPGTYNVLDPDRSIASRLEFTVGLDHMAYGSDFAPCDFMPEDCDDPVTWAVERIEHYVRTWEARD